MPWNEVDVSEQRMQFVIRAQSKQERLSVLCREFGISRPTGYLWQRRYQQSGSLAELAERLGASARLRIIPGADHFFGGREREIGAALVEELATL